MIRAIPHEIGKSWKKQYFSQVEVDEKILEQAYRKMSAQAIAVYAISADPPTWGHADIMMIQQFCLTNLCCGHFISISLKPW